MLFAGGGRELGAWFGAYVLMPDHLHAVVALDDGGGHRPPLQLSRWTKSLKNVLSKALRESGVSAPHWQKGFFDHVLRSSESYAQKWEYVRDNPVRANLVSRWQDWPFRGEPCELDL
jgi:putative transposase